MALTVTATATNGYDDVVLKVYVLTSATEDGGTAEAYVGYSAPTYPVTPAGTGSIIVGGILNSNGDNTVITPVADNATDDSGATAGHSEPWWFGHYTGTVTEGDSVSFGGTDSNAWNAAAIYEVLSAGSIAIDASTPAAADDGTDVSATTASFTPPGDSVLVAVVVTNSYDTPVIAVSDTSGLTWTQQGTTAYDAYIGASAAFTAKIAGGSSSSGPFAITLPIPAVRLTGSIPGTESGPFTITIPVPGTSLEASVSGGTVYTLWDNTLPSGTTSVSAGERTDGIQFTVTEACTLTGIAYYLPEYGTTTGSEYTAILWTTTSGLTGTSVLSQAGSGTWSTSAWNWVTFTDPYNLATGVTYVASIVSVDYLAYLDGYWTTGGPGVDGMTSGPITAPGSATALGGIQQGETDGSGFPGTNTSHDWYGVDVQVSAAGGGITSVFAIDLPALSVALTGVTRVTGNLTVALPFPVVSLAGAVHGTGSGPFTPVLPVPKVTLTGTVSVSGPFALALPAPKTVLSGSVAVSGPLAIALPAPAVHVTGITVATGPFAITLPHPLTSLTGSVSGNESGSFAPEIPVPRVSLSGVRGHNGAFAPSLPQPGISLAGSVTESVTGAFAVDLPSLAVSLSSAIGEIFSTFNIILPGGDASAIQSSLSAALPGPAVSLSAFIGTIGELAIELPLPEISLTGIDYHSELNIILAPPAVSLVGTDYYSRLAIGLPAPGVSLSGADGHVGGFAVQFGRTPMMLMRLFRLNKLRQLLNPKLASLDADTNWNVGSPGTGWNAGTPGTEWSVAYTSAQITSLSTQYVLVPVSATKAGSSYNPTADAVQFAFAPTPTYVPQESDWVAGSWQTVSTSLLYPYSAQCLVGPSGATALTNGTYVIYVMITDAPETPVLTAGQLIVT